MIVLSLAAYWYWRDTSLCGSEVGHVTLIFKPDKMWYVVQRYHRTWEKSISWQRYHLDISLTTWKRCSHGFVLVSVGCSVWCVYFSNYRASCQQGNKLDVFPYRRATRGQLQGTRLDWKMCHYLHTFFLKLILKLFIPSQLHTFTFHYLHVCRLFKTHTHKQTLLLLWGLLFT